MLPTRQRDRSLATALTRYLSGRQAGISSNRSKVASTPRSGQCLTLTLRQRTPTVCRRSSRARGTASGRVAPDDLTPSGPWAHYIERVLTRHPKVQGIAVMNEPNLGFIE